MKTIFSVIFFVAVLPFVARLRKNVIIAVKTLIAAMSDCVSEEHNDEYYLGNEVISKLLICK